MQKLLLRQRVSFSNWEKANNFLRLILIKRYRQILDAEAAIEMTAFILPVATYYVLKMRFGMKNFEITLVHGMKKILAALDLVDSFIDGPIVHTDNCEAQLQVLEELFWKFQWADLMAWLSKCTFRFESIKFLEHRIIYDWIIVNNGNWEKIRIA